MAVSPYLWKIIAPSKHSWEQEALDFIRENLSTNALFAWTNFEFIGLSGAIYEVDLLILTTTGLFLVEIKSWPGTISGDAYTWVLEHENGGPRTFDNPIFLTNSKCKELKSLLTHQKVFRTGKKVFLPFIQPLIFLSSKNLKNKLSRDALQHVYGRDTKEKPGIISALSPTSSGMKTPLTAGRIDRPTEKAVIKAMEEAGIKPRREMAQAGDYLLGDLIAQGPGYQDRIGRHASLPDVIRRIRQYLIPITASKEDRERIFHAARRDFQVVENVTYPGILRPLDFKEINDAPVIIFEHHLEALRLDHYLEKYDAQLDLWARLQLIREIAETLKYAHSRKIIHRGLSPQSIIMYYPELNTPTPKITNWQTAAREDITSGTVHIQELLESTSTAYLSPESVTNPKETGEYSDVFSMGTIGYHILTGSPPAHSYNELFQILQEHAGLHLLSRMDGTSSSLDELIRWATHPDVDQRIQNIEEFLDYLEEIEDELTTPDQDEVTNPLNAGAGDRMPGNFTVRRRLGRGSIGVALEVERDGEIYVLKLACDPSENARIHEEADILNKLKHPQIVEICEVVEIANVVGLLLRKAGEKTLAQRLKEEGALHLDLLQRFGDDLLAIISFLESKGISHRDIKPSNLGVSAIGKDDSLHLVLFDFSLSRAPLENIRAGTPQYLDPFLPLRKPERWDSSAERYAAGITLYEMATGILPAWGDGRSDPALVECELALEADRFEPGVRETLRQFFQKALNRDYTKRYDNAEEMRQAWNDAFRVKDAVSTPEVKAEPKEEKMALQQVSRDTPIVSLEISDAAKQALDRIGVITVENLLDTPSSQIRYIRGVGDRTRREISRTALQLREKLPEIDMIDTDSEAPDEMQVMSVDLVASIITGSRDESLSEQENDFQQIFLGINTLYENKTLYWPSQKEICTHLSIGLEETTRLLDALRKRWKNHQSIRLLIDDIQRILRANGGIMTVEELSAAVLGARGCILTDPGKRLVLAAAITRAACEVEHSIPTPKFQLRRHDELLLISISDELFEYALQLGKTADFLAREDPLISSYRAIDTLSEIETPPHIPPISSNRLLTLGAVMSSNAALSSKQEFYPRGMEARRALILSHGALLGDICLKTEDIKLRVATRYSEAQPLPDRPELDDLLKTIGWDFQWSEAEGAYIRGMDDTESLTSSRRIVRLATTMGTRTPVTPEVAEARQFEERLTYAHRGQVFLVLMIQPRWVVQGVKELLHRFDITVLSLDTLFLEAMKTVAQELEINWEVVLRADAAKGTRDWLRLDQLVKKSLPMIQNRILESSRTVLLVNPGLLARYDCMELLENLRDKAGNNTYPGLWLLLPCDEQNELPILDGKAIPLISPGQRVRIPEPWLRNVHRGLDRTILADYMK